jgi:5-methylcytosine-specific restriction endonuclease McrA
MTKKHLAVFGNIKMLRVYCPDCKGMTLVRDGIRLCCDRPSKETRFKKIKIESEPAHFRHKPSIHKQKEILKKQEDKCLYCGRKFGSPYLRDNKVKILQLNWDHIVPYSYSFNNKNNFVAACHICNGIKSNKIFNTVEEVFYYVEYHRKKKGITYYEDLPSVSEEICVQKE